MLSQSISHQIVNLGEDRLESNKTLQYASDLSLTLDIIVDNIRTKQKPCKVLQTDCLLNCDLRAKTRIKQNSDPQMEVFRILTDASESKEPPLMAISERLPSIDS